MGISMAVSPATNTVTVSKSMITNASFRTKKLPGLTLLSSLLNAPLAILVNRFSFKLSNASRFVLLSRRPRRNAQQNLVISGITGQLGFA